MRLSTLLALGLYAALGSARGGHDNDHGGGDGDGDGDGTATSSAPSATSTGNVTSGGFGGDLTGLTGDSACNSVSPHLESRSGTNLLKQAPCSLWVIHSVNVYLRRGERVCR